MGFMRTSGFGLSYGLSENLGLEGYLGTLWA